MTNENSRNMSFINIGKFHTVLAANLPPLLKISLLIFNESSPPYTKYLCNTIFVSWASLNSGKIFR
jgi:hypothetical protein